MKSQIFDEGYTDEDNFQPSATQPVLTKNVNLLSGLSSVQDCEELAYQLLASLPRSRLATIQRRLAPLLQFDVVGSLPTEVALQIFSHLAFPTLLTCSLVSRRWNSLANDQTLWKRLCYARGWEWRQPSKSTAFVDSLSSRVANDSWDDSDDEGMGDSDEEADDGDLTEMLRNEVEAAKAELTMMHAELDSGFASWSGASASTSTSSSSSNRMTVCPRTNLPLSQPIPNTQTRTQNRYSAPSILNSLSASSVPKPNYKLLHQTHVKLQKRFLTASYHLSALQTRGAPNNSHTNTIYCLQLYTYPSTGVQVLFTGSRDKTVREWNLSTGLVERVIGGVHASSVLSICVHNGILATAGSDKRVAIWDLEKNKLIKVISDHDDSVLCVRFDDERLVSCSKDRTVRTYKFPDLTPEFVLGAHRAAVNAVSISPTLIVSGSGDRSIRLWDAKTGKLLRTLENHHSRGIASIDFKPPYVLSGSSDKHLRLLDITTLQGWSTSPDSQYDSGHGHSYVHGFNVNVPLPLPLPSSSTAPFHTHFGASTSAGGFGAFGGHASGLGSAFGALDGGQAVLCQVCGSTSITPLGGVQRHSDGRNRFAVHGDLVRSVAFGEDFVLSGSYDLSIKVWDRKTGALVADLTGGHTGRIFCIGFDCTKIVSCGEDQRICIWDFSHGIDTSFIQL